MKKYVPLIIAVIVLLFIATLASSNKVLFSCIRTWLYLRDQTSLGVMSRYITGRTTTCTLRQVLDVPRIMQIHRSPEIKTELLTSDGKFELRKTPRGNLWVPAGNESDLREMLAEDIILNVYALTERNMSGAIVLDCGACIGTFTRSALNKGAAKVVAIEPGPENVECLRRNFQSEIASGKVIICPKGVWDKEDRLQLSIHPSSSQSDTFLLHPELKDGPTIPLTTIDLIVKEYGLERVDFIKMDIEGSEQRALKGAAEVIRRYHPKLAISAYHQHEDPVAIPKIVNGLGRYSTKCDYCTISGQEIRPNTLQFF